MKYAPILIPTLCRYQHLKKCIDSLKKNSWARFTDVYIALDYPPSEKYMDGYNKIIQYLETDDFSVFNKFCVIKRDHNVGSLKNSLMLHDYILEKYDRFIRTDDDCEFSPNFLEYMDKCLDMFENDPTVMGVTGYAYPVKWKIEDECNVFKNNAIFPMWGTGFWKDKYYKLKNEITNGYIRNAFFKNKIKRSNMTDARYLDAITEGVSENEARLTGKFSDVACGCYIQLTKQYIITPELSKVRNLGFDGSGEYCQNTLNSISKSDASTYDYRLQEIDAENGFIPVVDYKDSAKENRLILNRFDKRNESTIKKAIVKSWVIRVAHYIGVR